MLPMSPSMLPTKRLRYCVTTCAGRDRQIIKSIISEQGFEYSRFRETCKEVSLELFRDTKDKEAL